MYRRAPAVAGYFYEADPERLRKQIEWCFMHEQGPGTVPTAADRPIDALIGGVAPHAGYIYSGPVAAHLYAALAEAGTPDTVIIIGPNHYGRGTAVSIMTEGVWETPLGEVEIDSEVAEEIVKRSRLAAPDVDAHVEEHSIEVQLPFLQYIYGNRFKIVPIVMWMQTVDAAEVLGEAIAEAIRDRNAIVIASSDFSHYEPYDVAYKKDKIAIDAILAMDYRELYRRIVQYDISMCGPGPVMTLIYVAKKLGYTRPKLLKYATSGDTSGPKTEVVGYAAIVFGR